MNGVDEWEENACWRHAARLVLLWFYSSPVPRAHVPPVLQQHISGPDAANRIFIGGLPYYLNEEQVGLASCPSDWSWWLIGTACRPGGAAAVHSPGSLQASLHTITPTCCCLAVTCCAVPRAAGRVWRDQDV